jgi:hypothetical protein
VESNVHILTPHLTMIFKKEKDREEYPETIIKGDVT